MNLKTATIALALSLSSASPASAFPAPVVTFFPNVQKSCSIEMTNYYPGEDPLSNTLPHLVNCVIRNTNAIGEPLDVYYTSGGEPIGSDMCLAELADCKADSAP